MRSILKKGLIYVWILSILINACPVVVLASFFQKEELISNLEERNLEKEKKETSKIVGEILEKRTNNEKHYRLEDGSIKAYIYPEAIHYEENGELIDIDNTLVKSASGFKNKRNNLSSEFSKEENLLILSYKDHVISWQMQEVEKVEGKVEGGIARKLTSSIPSLESKLTYSNVFKDIDLEYELVSDRIEENIIIKDRESLKTEYTYFLKTEDLSMKQLANNEIAFLDKDGKEIFYISAPVMYDSNLEFNSNILLKPKKVDNGYEILLQADNEWLMSKERIYPITIDPIIATSPNRDDIVDTFIYPNDSSNTGKGNAHILRVGSTSYSDVGQNKNPFRSLVKFSLPALTSGDQVIAAELHIFNYQNTNDWTPPSGNIQIDIHAVTKDWNESNAYWNNMKDSYHFEIIDYIKYTYDSNNQNKENTANITKLVKDWYTTGNNYGLLLKEHVEKKVSGRNDVSFISSDTSSAYTYKRPYIIIQYRNQTGLENYLTTHTQSIGRTTTLTNDYNGNLTLLHNDASTPGNRLPVSINHVYNTNDKDSNIGYGNGFRLNLNQTLKSINISGIDYLEYIDEDATRHYFYKESNTWKDEDGLNLTITASGTNYIMKDKSGNESLFVKSNDKWYLKEIKDTNNNKITINYASNPNLITSVQDAVGDTLTLTYSNNLLTSIKDKDNRVITYGYNSNNLTSITYPDSLKTQYQYTNTKLLSKVIDVDNSSILYTYYSKSPYRIKSVTEYGSNGSLGNSITMTYGNNTTSFRDNKGHLENYTFNHLGQTLNINSLDKNQSLKNAYGVSYQYGTSTSNKNKLLLETTMVKATNNAILNSSAESNFTNWNLANWGSNPGNVSISNDFYLGKHSFKLESTTQNSNPILWQSSPMVAGETYTLSAYLKGNVDAYFFYEYKDSTGYHHEFLGPIPLTDSFERYSKTFTIPSDSISNTKVGISIFDVGSINIDNVQLEEGTVTNPYNLSENGDFTNGINGWDSQANLGSSDKVVDINGIKAFQMMGEMEKWKHLYKTIPVSGKKGDSFHVSFWAKNNGVPMDNSKADKLVFQFLNSSGTVLYSEVINVLNDTNSWQYLSNNFVAKQDYEGLKIILAYNYNTSYTYFTNIGVYKDEVGNSYTYDTNGNVISTSDLAKQNSRYFYSSKNELIGALNPKGRMFYYEYDYNHSNRLLQAFNQKGLTSSYEYDEYGNITSNKISEPAMIRNIEDIKENTYYELRAVVSNLKIGVKNNNVETIDGVKKWKFIKSGTDYLIVDENNQALTIQDSKKDNGTNILVTKNNQNNNQKFKLSYNNDGTYSFQSKVTDYKSCVDINGAVYVVGRNIQQYQCLLSDAQKYMILPLDSNEKYIETKTQYSENGNYQTKVIDQRGKEVTTTYNESRGTISNVLDAKGNKTEYTYDNKDRVTQIKSGNTINSYTYDKDYLKKINHNNFDYEFIKDEYGNTTSITVAGTPLITHQYEANNGYLLKSTYGNNQSINYEYDSFGRINKKINTTGTATYTYNNRGSLDHLNYLNNDYYYTYDLSGRITNIKENNLEKKYQYDNYNNLSKVKYKYNTKELEVSYTYDEDDKITTITYPDYSIHYTYDTLDRLVKKEIIKGDKKYTTTYEYYDVDDTKTTTLLKSITNGNNTLEYTYDANGNIIKITDNGTLINQYEYDSLNQLTKVQNYHSSSTDTIQYTYDNGGNITKKVDSTVFNKQKIVAAGDGSVTVHTFYTYDDNWKDQLRKVNDNSITYDTIGNMTSYNGYNYTWSNGNELKSITNGSNQSEYEYNIEGIRTKKTVNGKTTNYYLEENNIIYEKRDGKIIEYLYDESGISGLKVDNKNYYFVKNIQGDIIEILDEEFNVVAKYTYDAWGVVTVNNLTEDNIGDINPYRYRGYYYDTESKLYYLNSRYYNPSLGRFISAEPNVFSEGFDENSGLLAYNVYDYCANNPIMYKDDSGEGIILACVIIGAVAGGAYGVHRAKKNGYSTKDGWNFWKYVGGYGTVGGALGGFTGWAIGKVVAIKTVSVAISATKPETISHIMQAKHAWTTVVNPATWETVNPLIKSTLLKGTTTLINAKNGIKVYEVVKNKFVVRYAIIDGIMRIADAWVKTR